MAIKHTFPQQLTARGAETSAGIPTDNRQERYERHRNSTLRVVSGCLLVIAGVTVLAVFYVAKLVLVTLMISIIVAFMLEPFVCLLERIRLPRSLGAMIAVLLLAGVVYGAAQLCYNRAISFMQELPKYSQKIKGVLSHLKQKTDQIQQTTERVLPQDGPKKPLPVKLESGSGASALTSNLGAVTEIVLTMAFVPFLVYFMLSWKEHARKKTVQLFRHEHRTTAYVTLGQISLMMRSFIAGNFTIAIFLSIGSAIVFATLGLPYFYFLGLMSGFLSIMPYLGIVLAIIPPLAAGLGILDATGVVVVIVTITGLHVLAMNVLYPKLLGKRLQLNPLAVTISLLIWGWIWGAMGLILAMPLMGAIKIVCDHVGSLRAIGEWMGE